MSTETANLIVACASLVVMVVTFFFTFKMYVYMKKSDLLKSRNEDKRRRKDIMAQIDSKKKHLEHLKLMANLNGSGPDSQEIIDLEFELYELSKRL